MSQPSSESSPESRSEPPPAAAAPDDSDRTARRRLVLMARPRATKANAFAALLAILLGFAVATQVRQNQSLGLESLRQSDLVTILDNTTQRSARLDQNARELQATRDALVSGSTNEAAALKAAQERLDVLGILAGTARAHGPGIRITVRDPQAKVSSILLLDAIEELRNARVEAIQVNNVRVVASTHFAQAGSGTIKIDDTSITEPYVITAIGDPPTIASAMEIPGGLAVNVRGLGAEIAIVQEKDLTVGALHTPRQSRYARPVPSQAPAATP